jgi:hypothetical protein
MVSQANACKVWQKYSKTEAAVDDRLKIASQNKSAPNSIFRNRLFQG